MKNSSAFVIGASAKPLKPGIVSTALRCKLDLATPGTQTLCKWQLDDGFKFTLWISYAIAAMLSCSMHLPAEDTRPTVSAFVRLQNLLHCWGGTSVLHALAKPPLLAWLAIALDN